MPSLYQKQYTNAGFIYYHAVEGKLYELMWSPSRYSIYQVSPDLSTKTLVYADTDTSYDSYLVNYVPELNALVVTGNNGSTGFLDLIDIDQWKKIARVPGNGYSGWITLVLRFGDYYVIEEPGANTFLWYVEAQYINDKTKWKKSQLPANLPVYAEHRLAVFKDYLYVLQPAVVDEGTSGYDILLRTQDLVNYEVVYNQPTGTLPNNGGTGYWTRVFANDVYLCYTIRQPDGFHVLLSTDGSTFTDIMTVPYIPSSGGKDENHCGCIPVSDRFLVIVDNRDNESGKIYVYDTQQKAVVWSVDQPPSHLGIKVTLALGRLYLDAESLSTYSAYELYITPDSAPAPTITKDTAGSITVTGTFNQAIVSDKFDDASTGNVLATLTPTNNKFTASKTGYYQLRVR
jgi:hypothetical protein